MARRSKTSKRTPSTRSSRKSTSRRKRSSKNTASDAPGKLAIQRIREQTKELDRSIKRITKEMEKVTDKNYALLVTKARNAWKKEFDEDLDDTLVTQLVISFLSEKMQREYIEMIKAHMSPEEEKKKKEDKTNVQKGGANIPTGVVNYPFNEFKVFPSSLPAAQHGNLVNAFELYDHPAQTVGTCGGPLAGGKRRGTSKRRRRPVQRGGSYNPFPLSLPHYFPATVAPGYSPPATGYLARPSSFVRGYFDVLNGSSYQTDPATTGSLGDASNSILHEANPQMDPNYVPM